MSPKKLFYDLNLLKKFEEIYGNRSLGSASLVRRILTKTEPIFSNLSEFDPLWDTRSLQFYSSEFLNSLTVTSCLDMIFMYYMIKYLYVHLKLCSKYRPNKEYHSDPTYHQLLKYVKISFTSLLERKKS